MQHIITLLGKIMEVSAQITMKGAYNVHCDWSAHVQELTVRVHDKNNDSIKHAAAEIYVYTPDQERRYKTLGDPTAKLERLLTALQAIQLYNAIPPLPGFVDHGGYSASVVNLIAEREEVEA